jgi:predicted PurR-regulated permease PerM
MNTDSSQPPDKPDRHPLPASVVLLKRLYIWALFLVLLYLARDFFFMAFMTFLFSYLTLSVVGWGMRRLSPGRDRPALRRLLTVGVFVLAPLALFGVGALIGPELVDQAERLAGWMNQASLEKEVGRLFEGAVGPSEFAHTYGGPDDPRYRQALEEFRKSGARHVAAYQEFPHLEAWVEAGFSKQFLEAERGRARQQLAQEGTSSKAFTQWFLTEKVPELQAQARKQVPEHGRPAVPVDPLVREAASAKPEQLLEQARRDPATLASLRQEWIQDSLERAVAAAKGSADYLKRFHAYYDRQRAKAPASFPYTFEQYVELQKVRPQGARAFGEALEKMMPTAQGQGEARLRADFEAAKKHELFEQWWATNSTARFVRHQIETRLGGGDTGHMDRVVSSLLNIPVDLGTALILSLFICIDFPNLRRAAQRLRETWLRDVYEELTPAFRDLGELMGRSLRAQGLIALCNAVLLFVGLLFLGVDHAVFLSVAAFVLCLVPTLGTVLAWALIAVMALIQPGGGMALALKASGLVLVVILIENFVLAPRIVGKMMELHPVLIIALLPLAQYFFGVWGLILATPVAVYVVHVLILRRGLPGREASHRPATAGPAPPPPELPSGAVAVGPKEGVAPAPMPSNRSQEQEAAPASVLSSEAR